MIKNRIKKILLKFGYEIKRIQPVVERSPTVCFEYTSLREYQHETASIPGLVAQESADVLYALCRTQELRGDVLEIGSWQGKSTSYLARAVKDSGNGRVVAIDHFKGAPGREAIYRLSRDDLSDLEEGFRENMIRLGLDRIVTLLPLPSHKAHELITDRAFRFIFIDGDHTEEGVRLDIQLFCPLLLPGGLVVFDDFDATFPGLVRAVEEWVQETRPSMVFGQRNMLICRV